MSAIRISTVQCREDVKMEMEAVAVVPQWGLEWPFVWTLGEGVEHQVLDGKQDGGWHLPWNEGQSNDHFLLQEEEVILDEEENHSILWIQPSCQNVEKTSLVDRKQNLFTGILSQEPVDASSSNLFDFSMEDVTSVIEDVTYTKVADDYLYEYAPELTERAQAMLPVQSEEMDAMQHFISSENSSFEDEIPTVDLVSSNEIDDLMATLFKTSDMSMMLGNFELAPLLGNFDMSALLGSAAMIPTMLGDCFETDGDEEPSTPISVCGSIFEEFFSKKTGVKLEAGCQTEDPSLESDDDDDDESSGTSDDEEFDYRKRSKKQRKPIKRCHGRKPSNRKAYSRLSQADKRERKREQNKNAATKYRVKKRCLESVMETECEALERRNGELRREVVDKEREVKVMRKLVVDVFRAAAAENVNAKRKK